MVVGMLALLLHKFPCNFRAFATLQAHSSSPPSNPSTKEILPSSETSSSCDSQGFIPDTPNSCDKPPSDSDKPQTEESQLHDSVVTNSTCDMDTSEKDALVSDVIHISDEAVSSSQKGGNKDCSNGVQLQGENNAAESMLLVNEKPSQSTGVASTSTGKIL